MRLICVYANLFIYIPGCVYGLFTYKYCAVYYVCIMYDCSENQNEIHIEMTYKIDLLRMDTWGNNNNNNEVYASPNNILRLLYSMAKWILINIY